MQSSIEMRSPFIDYRLMELAFSIPDEKKLDEGITKKILRDLFREKLPGSIVNNHNKTGFMTPFDDWMKQEKTNKSIKEIMNSESFNSKSIFKPKLIRDKFNKADSNKSFPFWRFINLELWSKIYKINNL
jgi:asparagine synthase (glutamine-hydrolysing)